MPRFGYRFDCARRRGVSANHYTLGLGGSRFLALHKEEKPLRPCEPSQNGLFSAIPQRQREITVRPASPYELPSASWMTNSPSSRMGPLLKIVTFAGMFPDGSKGCKRLPYNCHRGYISDSIHLRVRQRAIRKRLPFRTKAGQTADRNVSGLLSHVHGRRRSGSTRARRGPIGATVFCPE